MIPERLFPHLAKGAREAVWEAFCAAHHNTSHPLPEEVEHVYALIDTGLKALQPAWAAVLAPLHISLRVTGVFIHQTPRALYHHPLDGLVAPELGDLLIVHEHSGPLSFRKAVLTQVKRCQSGEAHGPRDEHQEYLYQNWPDFVLKGRDPRGRPYLRGSRTIRPNFGGSRYGLVADDIDPHHGCPICFWNPGYVLPWVLSDPMDPACFAGGEDLGGFIANMLYRSSWPRGRDAVPPPTPLALSPPGATNNHFDVTIQELLDLTGERTMRFKRYPHISGKRGRPVTCFQLASLAGPPLPSTGAGFAPIDSDGGRDGVHPERPADEVPEGGISTLLIETSFAD